MILFCDDAPSCMILFCDDAPSCIAYLSHTLKPLRKKVVDFEREDMKLPDTMTMEGFEYGEATYHNVIRQYEWSVFLFSFSAPEQIKMYFIQLSPHSISIFG